MSLLQCVVQPMGLYKSVIMQLWDFRRCLMKFSDDAFIRGRG